MEPDKSIKPVTGSARYNFFNTIMRDEAKKVIKRDAEKGCFGMPTQPNSKHSMEDICAKGLPF